jgi:hypothetical protein
MLEGKKAGMLGGKEAWRQGSLEAIMLEGKKAWRL